MSPARIDSVLAVMTVDYGRAGAAGIVNVKRAVCCDMYTYVCKPDRLSQWYRMRSVVLAARSVTVRGGVLCVLCFLTVSFW